MARYLLPALLSSCVVAQNVIGTATTNSALSKTTSLELSVDDLWDVLVGPVAVANITTIVEATPIPTSSLIPPPNLASYSFPNGRQIPEMVLNSSWSFPKDFWLGVAGAAYQIEGAVKDDGRGPSIWDKLTRVPGYTVANQTGDIADNNYYFYKQDIARIAAMGINTYSFSISWSRIYPFGAGPINQAGIDHYNDVINTCLAYNVTPTVTLFHWDLPLFLQEKYGGWLSEDIVDDFVAYANTSFQAFGDRVKTWFTLNEPIVFCDDYPLPDQYFKNFSIPYKQQPYYCGRNAVLAHAKAYRLGKSLLGNDTLISFKNNGGYKIPLTNSSADAQAVQRAYDYNEGWFADPIFLTGTWPDSLNDYLSTFLEPFTSDEQTLIKGTADLFAHDAYTSQFYYAPDVGIEACLNDTTNSLYPGCFNTSYTYSTADGGWLIGAAADANAPWLHKATDWVPALLHYINDTWAPPLGRILVSEFGFAEPFEVYKTIVADVLTDQIRSDYYKAYMEGILIALSEGLNIMGSLAWSFVDNLEWADGYTVKFGMQRVDFDSPSLDRSYKASFFQYVDVFKQYIQQ
ncbi:glycoside hydrolase superfamily [Coniella lustricola]|uniref:Glycoside hydrolase superfamily n=1 Tax=Coniella lustricola TaxID=2025994 RepID=A0A2T3ABW1_9PEZI|nr:glycoside hydrolase superfamily [Coniella lustricola]